MVTRSEEREEMLRSRLARLTRSLHGLESGERRAVHRTRVASRRLRELLRVVGLNHALTVKLGHQLRRITRRLGALRELDVVALLIDELHESRRCSPAALRLVADEVRRAR